ncbi:IucA/IucC family protein [Streptomyces sp. NPDC006274]|uniref:IucA/IucC family protein n=1 Tax=unclassified Streptomyces TaxID=2593676 RepID=UPI0033B3B875
MNPTPAPDAPESPDGPAGHHREQGGVSGPLTLEPATVPRQAGRLDEARDAAAATPTPPGAPGDLDRPGRPGSLAHLDGSDRPGDLDRPDRPGSLDHLDRLDRPDRAGRSDRSGLPDRADRPVAEPDALGDLDRLKHSGPLDDPGPGARPDHLDSPDQAEHPDPLDDPDARRAADTATVENLLRCWVRENDLARPDGPTLRILLAASGTALLVPVHYWSATGWHRFGSPALEGSPDEAARADAVTVAALLGRESGHGEGSDLVARVADSARRTADFITDRRRRPTAPPEADLFLTAEQSLLLGHPLHPTPKSREGLSESEARSYSPELYGSFPLHWMAVDKSVLAAESAWTEQGRAITAGQLTSRLAGDLPRPDNSVALPLHPWQARDIRQRAAVSTLLDAGLLHDLGPHGDLWYPTSSVRTVHRPGAPAMLKLSLGLRITNSCRENLRKELHRGVEVHRLLRAGLAEQWRAAHPRFDIVRDPAWLAVDTPDAGPVHGLDVMIRHNPFGPGDDAVCIAALTTPRPWPGRAGMRSRLAVTVERLAARTGRPLTAVAAEWFLRYLDQVVRPVLWLDATAGIALEAHQQNTIVLLDPDGWPTGGRYRDNQGYYFRESHRERLEARLPGIGADSDTFVSDDVTDERFAYYLAINNVLGLIGAFGAQRLADERVLLAAFRQFLASAAGMGSPLPGQLLETPTLRCKANLLTRLHGLDELVGPVDTQSVYVTIANPLRSS